MIRQPHAQAPWAHSHSDRIISIADTREARRLETLTHGDLKDLLVYLNRQRIDRDEEDDFVRFYLDVARKLGLIGEPAR